MPSASAAPRPVLAAGIAIVVVAMVVAVLLLSRPDGPVSTRTVDGWAAPNDAGTAISLHATPDGTEGEGHIVAGASWQDVDGAWHDGTDLPTCIGTDTASMVPVELGIATVAAPDGPTTEKVVWLRCQE